MARMVHDIFLASPFEEFQLLRKMLNIEINKMTSRFPIALVDLNDGAVTHSPPLQECVIKAQQSDFMILLMGDTYGSYAPNQNKSYTHLEYQSVMYKNSPTIVLVFCIGDSYENNCIKYSDNVNFKDFQQLVEKHHTIGYFSKNKSLEEIGQKIIQELLIAISMRVMNGHVVEEPSVLNVNKIEKSINKKLPNVMGKVTDKITIGESQKELISSEIIENNFIINNKPNEARKILENYVEKEGLGVLSYKVTTSNKYKYIFSIFLNGKEIAKHSGQKKLSVENHLLEGTLSKLKNLKTETKKQNSTSLQNKSYIPTDSVLKDELEKYVKKVDLGILSYKITSSKRYKYIFSIFLNEQVIGKHSGQNKFNVESTLFKTTIDKLKINKTSKSKSKMSKKSKRKAKEMTRQLGIENQEYTSFIKKNKDTKKDKLGKPNKVLIKINSIIESLLK